MPTKPQPNVYLLWRAVEAEIGVEVSTNNRKLLRQQLYKLMNANPVFTGLSIMFPPDEDKLWIMKTGVSDVDTA